MAFAPTPPQVLTRPAGTRSASSRVGILKLIRETSARHQNDHALTRAGLSAKGWHILFQAMIEAESSYNPTAVSPKGAYGLGQLMPQTARSLGVDPRNVSQNLDGAARYLLAQLASFQNTNLALAAYNAGPRRVVDYSGVPPFAETRSYIARIHRIRNRLMGQPVSLPPIHLANQRPKRAPVLIKFN
jgi:soluble lytic murein transglycosylase-like protein